MRISFTEISTVIEQSSRKRFAVSVNLAGLDFNKLLTSRVYEGAATRKIGGILLAFS